MNEEGVLREIEKAKLALKEKRAEVKKARDDLSALESLLGMIRDGTLQ